MNKKQTRTATIKDMRSLTNAAEKHAGIAEHAAETARIHADAGREYTTRTKGYSATACFHANRADDNAKRAELNAEDAATYAGAARICLLLTILINAIVVVIFYTLHN